MFKPANQPKWQFVSPWMSHPDIESQRKVQIWYPCGQKLFKNALIYYPRTFPFEVLILSMSDLVICLVCNMLVPHWPPSLAPSKNLNYIPVFWCTYVPNLVLLDKFAQYPLQHSIRAWTIKSLRCLPGEFVFCPFSAFFFHFIHIQL